MKYFRWQYFLAAMVVVYLLNRLFGWAYDYWPDLDIPMHVLGGFLAAALGIAAWVEWRRRLNVKNMPPEAIALFAICFAALIAVTWEFYEFGMDVWRAGAGDILVGRMQPSLPDTMKDLANGLVGACIAVIVFKKEL